MWNSITFLVGFFMVDVFRWLLVEKRLAKKTK